MREDKERLREGYGIHYFERHRYFCVVEELVEEKNQYQTVGLEKVRGNEVDIGKGRGMVYAIHNYDAWVVQEKELLIHNHCALAVLERAPEIRSHYA